LRYYIIFGEFFTPDSGIFEDVDVEVDNVDTGTARKRKGKEKGRYAAAFVRTNIKRIKLVECYLSKDDVNVILPGSQSRTKKEALVGGGEDVISKEPTPGPSFLAANGNPQASESYRPRRGGKSMLSKSFIILKCFFSFNPTIGV